jgi:hypothetical protein
VADSDVINEAANQESIPSSTQVTKINGLTLEKLRLTNALSTDYAKADNIENECINELLAIERIGTQYR